LPAHSRLGRVPVLAVLLVAGRVLILVILVTQVILVILVIPARVLLLAILNVLTAFVAHGNVRRALIVLYKMAKNNKYYIIVSIIIIVVVATAYYAISRQRTIDLDEPFSINDSRQRIVVSAIIYEYMGLEGTYPDRFGQAYSKESADEQLHCFSFMGGMSQSSILSTAQCPNPEYWNYYHYSHNNSAVGVGYMIFRDDETAKQYIDGASLTLDRFINVFLFAGGRIENPAIAFSKQLGESIDDHAFFRITNSPSYFLISMIREGDTVYTVFERSTEDITSRNLHMSFMPQYRAQYVAQQPYALI
jgi:hypothetical protein